jgi:hypothetical protein
MQARAHSANGLGFGPAYREALAEIDIGVLVNVSADHGASRKPPLRENADLNGAAWSGPEPAGRRRDEPGSVWTR